MQKNRDHGRLVQSADNGAQEADACRIGFASGGHGDLRAVIPRVRIEKNEESRVSLGGAFGGDAAVDASKDGTERSAPFRR